MKFTISIDGIPVILSATKLEIIVEALADCEMVQNKYMGAGKGTSGGDYIRLLTTYDAHSQMIIRPLPEHDYDAMKFITANQSK